MSCFRFTFLSWMKCLLHSKMGKSCSFHYVKTCTRILYIPQARKYHAKRESLQTQDSHCKQIMNAVFCIWTIVLTCYGHVMWNVLYSIYEWLPFNELSGCNCLEYWTYIITGFYSRRFHLVFWFLCLLLHSADSIKVMTYFSTWYSVCVVGKWNALANSHRWYGALDVRYATSQGS